MEDIDSAVMLKKNSYMNSTYVPRHGGLSLGQVAATCGASCAALTNI
ncbi:MAG: hypothetical protein ACLTK0_10945 [Anaerovoracaceae bacterium]